MLIMAQNVRSNITDQGGYTADTNTQTQELGKADIKPDLTELVDEDSQTNKKWILCHVCGSKILRPHQGRLQELEYKLPLMAQKNSGEIKEETIKKFWLVVDMLTFENVGFTNTKNNLKYLTCADCEIGPIGFQDLADKKNLFVAIDRVTYGA